MCSISVCSLKLRPFIVWKLWPGQKFKVKSVLFQKSGADNFRTQTAIQILRPRCTTRHQGDSLWEVSNNSDGNCRRSCAHKKLLTDGRTDRQTDGRTDDRGYNIIRPFGRIKRRNCSLRAISPFPMVISKDLNCRHVKPRACLGRASIFVPVPWSITFLGSTNY